MIMAKAAIKPQTKHANKILLPNTILRNTKGQRFRLGITHAVHMQIHVAFFSL